jgi:hypothetical protein
MVREPLKRDKSKDGFMDFSFRCHRGNPRGLDLILSIIHQAKLRADLARNWTNVVLSKNGMSLGPVILCALRLNLGVCDWISLPWSHPYSGWWPERKGRANDQALVVSSGMNSWCHDWILKVLAIVGINIIILYQGRMHVGKRSPMLLQH